MGLTAENYTQGFLVDDELMAGITESPDQAGRFTAYVLRHTTGEYLGHQPGLSLDEALALINRIPRLWAFESTRGCDGTKCEPGKCKGEGCKVFDRRAAAAAGSSCHG
jgi:hypothetical protein